MEDGRCGHTARRQRRVLAGILDRGALPGLARHKLRNAKVGLRIRARGAAAVAPVLIVVAVGPAAGASSVVAIGPGTGRVEEYVGRGLLAAAALGAAAWGPAEVWLLAAGVAALDPFVELGSAHTLLLLLLLMVVVIPGHAEVAQAETEIRTIGHHTTTTGHHSTAHGRLRLLVLQILGLLGRDLVLQVGDLLLVLGDLNVEV